MDDAELCISQQEALKELTISNIRKQAQASSLSHTGKCHYCSEPISAGVYCDADCASWHREELAAIARKYGKRPSDLA